MRAVTAVCCLLVPVTAAACSEGARWEVVATFDAEVTDPHSGDECADLAGDTTRSFTAPTDEGGRVMWRVETRDQAAADRVAACFDPLADEVEVREK